MMKNVYLIAAAAAAVLVAGCAKNEVIQTPQEMTPVTFGVYNGRMATKAVSTTTYGQINTNELLQGSVGFGVFAYYSDGAANAYDGTNFIPNFMYNQKVAYTDTTVPADGIADAWTYSPIKYWPNEYNTSDAIGADVDKLTFFAYAPHVTTVGTEGITAFSANTATGDPTITFKVPASQAEQIDLLWSNANTKNMIKQAVGGKVQFSFKHALSNLTILPIAVVDATTTIPASAGTNVATGTLVKVNSITLTGKFNQEGTLNIATGDWVTSAATSDQNVTYSPATALDVTAINDKAEADGDYTSNPVGKYPEFMFVPSTDDDLDGHYENLTITINYDFITTDSAVNGGTVTVHNVIHKTLNDFQLEKSKKMKLYLGLGMTTVLFNAEVANWTDGGSEDVWLPVNL